MSTFSTYYFQNTGLQVLTPAPTSTGGKPINNNFLKVATQRTTTDPSPSNDNTQGYLVGCRWINTNTNSEFVCLSNATGTANWQNIAAIYHDTSTNLASIVLQVGQMAVATDTGKMAVGDGSTAFANLPGWGGLTDIFTIFGNSIQFSTGGNSRGTGAADLQSSRSSSTQVASGAGSFVTGKNNTASGAYSHATGSATTASGVASHAEGTNSSASGHNSHAEGGNTTASANYSHAEGYTSHATSSVAHAEGDTTTASGFGSHTEGGHTTASSNYSHAEGWHATAGNIASHAEGHLTSASGYTSHAEGSSTSAYGTASHTEGSSTTGSGTYSHAEGYKSTASGYYGSHSEGNNTLASGNESHAEGNTCTASASSSHASGSFSYAAKPSQNAQAGGSYDNSTQGLGQVTTTTLIVATANATQTEMTIDGNSPSGSSEPTSNRFLIISGKSYAITVTVSGKEQSSSSYVFMGKYAATIVNVSGSITLSSVQNLITAINPGTWGGVVLQVNSSPGSLQVMVTGTASTNIRWAAIIEAVEITY